MPKYRLTQHSMDVVFKQEAQRFLPLMQRRRPRREVVAETVELARHLPERQQRQAVAALIGLGHRFLTAGELDT